MTLARARDIINLAKAGNKQLVIGVIFPEPERASDELSYEIALRRITKAMFSAFREEFEGHFKPLFFILDENMQLGEGASVFEISKIACFKTLEEYNTYKKALPTSHEERKLSIEIDIPPEFKEENTNTTTDIKKDESP